MPSSYRHLFTLFSVMIGCVALSSPHANAQDANCTSSDQLKFSAQDVSDDASGIVLRGRAWLCFEGNAITATEMRYDRSSGRGGANGGVQVRDLKGNVTSAERLDFSAELNAALARRSAR
jgi:lipopolysaccharide assembly outer membrane protein LptD (OstA)